MTDVSDEMLMAYADNELDAADRTRAESYLAQNPEAAHRLAAFAATGRGLGGMFDAPMHQPVPHHLIDAVRGAAPGEERSSATAASAQIIAFETAQQRRKLASVLPQWAAAAAACVALIAAGLGAQRMMTPVASETFGAEFTAEGVKIAGPVLAAALETAAGNSDSEVTIDGARATVRPVFTFAATSGGYCRQYEIHHGETASIAGVACRDASSHWRIEGQMAARRAQRPAASKTAPAQVYGEAPAAIDAIVERMSLGDMLGPEDEAAVLTSGWQKPMENKSSN